jgi:hypothetical protein
MILSGRVLFVWAAANVILELDISNGDVLRTYSCYGKCSNHKVVGLPVNCMALATVNSDDIIIAGLQCQGNAYMYLSSYTSADDEDLDDLGAGNIYVFQRGNELLLETWRGHSAPVIAMAVVDKKYLVTVGATYVAHSVLLWDMELGVPLWRLDLNENEQSHRIRDVCGISVHGPIIVLLCNYGECLALLDTGGETSFDILGYAELKLKTYEDDFSGATLSRCGQFVVTVHQDFKHTLVFDLATLPRESSLEPDRGLRARLTWEDMLSDREEEEDTEDGNPHSKETRHRHVAAARIEWPTLSHHRPQGRFGPPFHNWGSSSSVSSQTTTAADVPHKYEREEGGPRVVAMDGNRCFVAGYYDGSIRVQMLLPDVTATSTSATATTITTTEKNRRKSIGGTGGDRRCLSGLAQPYRQVMASCVPSNRWGEGCATPRLACPDENSDGSEEYSSEEYSSD